MNKSELSVLLQYIIVFKGKVTILTLKCTLESCAGHFCWRKVPRIQESSCNVPPCSHSQAIKEITAEIQTGCAQRRANTRFRNPEFGRSDPHGNMKNHSLGLSKLDISFSLCHWLDIIPLKTLTDLRTGPNSGHKNSPSGCRCKRPRCHSNSH